jgi:hypothetical protein
MNIPKISALFETSLASAMTAAATSFTLASATDRDGNALSSRYGFIIDEGTADEEFVIGTVSGTTVTIEYRGIDADAPNTEVSANKKAHRRGASVKISDYPILGVMRNILNGDETLPNKLSYASAPSFNSASNELATVKFAEDQANQGAADASTSQKGLAEEATQAEVDAGTAAGSAARLFLNPLTLRAKRYHSFAADAGASDAYAITVSPSIAAYTDGDVFVFEAATVNTGAATLNVNTVGAKTIKKYGNVDLATGDIKAGSIVMVVYDADSDTLMLVSSIARPQVSQDGAEIYAADSVGSDSYAVTLTPAPGAYAIGMVVRFKAGTANTGAATLNVNSLGAVTIKKNYNSDLVTGDILQNQIVEVVHDGTNFQMLSPSANSSAALTSISFTTGIATRAGDAASGAQTIAHGLSSAPKRVRITAVKRDAGAGDTNASIGVYVPSTTATAFWQAAALAGNDTTNMVVIKDNGDTTKQEATISVDATNITLTWTKTGSPNSATINLLWEAETNA